MHRGLTLVSPLLPETHCTVLPSEVLHRSGVDIVPQSPDRVYFILGAFWEHFGVHTTVSAPVFSLVQHPLPGQRKGTFFGLGPSR